MKKILCDINQRRRRQLSLRSITIDQQLRLNPQICHTNDLIYNQKIDLMNQWLDHVDPVQRQLLVEAEYLLEREKKAQKSQQIVDYGFLVYPAAKAYEGFLKHFFYRNGLIDAHMYQSDHFRIGKAVNPDLPEKYREDGWVYDDISRLFGDDLPPRLWSTWRKCRNHVFHFKPDKLRLYTLVEAQIKVELIFSTIELAIEREQLFTQHRSHNHQAAANFAAS